MRNVSRIVGLALFVCLLISAVALCVIIFGRMDQTITAVGKVVPADYVNLTPEVSGIIERVLVREGDTVGRGDTVLILSSDDFRFQTDQAARNLSEARAQLLELEEEYRTLTESESFELSAVLADLEAAEKRMELARRTYTRKKELYDKNLISAEEMESAELSYDVAGSNYRVLSERHKMLGERYRRLITERKRGVELAEEAHRLARAKLDRTILLSPTPGTVVTREAEDLVGVMAKEGEPLLRIADLSRMQFAAVIRENDIAEVWSGLPAEVHISAFPHREYKVFTGNVTSVSSIPTVTESGVTYEAMITIDEPWIEKDDKRFHIMPGMSGYADIVIESDVRLVTILLDSFDK